MDRALNSAVKPVKLFLSALFLAALLSACATTQPTIYYWGEYQPLLLKEHKMPNSLSISEKIQLLNEDIIKAQSQGKKIAPGFYAHLGYLYFQEGDDAAAEQALFQEKSLFPESAHFIDGLLERKRLQASAQ